MCLADHRLATFGYAPQITPAVCDFDSSCRPWCGCGRILVPPLRGLHRLTYDSVLAFDIAFWPFGRFFTSYLVTVWSRNWSVYVCLYRRTRALLCLADQRALPLNVVLRARLRPWFAISSVLFRMTFVTTSSPTGNRLWW